MRLLLLSLIVLRLTGQVVVSAGTDGQAVPASVTITVIASEPPIQLPIEVIGLDGTVKSVSFSIPATATGPFTLSLRVHGVKYETEASFQLNASNWISLSTGSVNILGLGANYGGIGGGFTTLDMTVPIPTGTIVPGTNVITFRFNKTNGIVSGFRVLALNVQDASGASLLAPSNFTWDDPNTWQPPLPDAANIAAGKSLFYNSTLTSPIAIKATCTHCHAQDGRDLKYFNYSNYSIRARAMFHGLTATQGDQIASYIRSLNVPNPGRPWNPPYQPGPGMDAAPVQNWSAGSGIDGVLKRDADMWPYLAPGGDTSKWAPTGDLKAREIPIALQLPDWNSWLPINHPMDAWGTTFTANVLATNYNAVRAGLAPGTPQAYQNIKSGIWLWRQYQYQFLTPLLKPTSDPSWNNPSYTQSIYSVGLWSMTKNWEINQEFGLEGLGSYVFGAAADPREWYSAVPFIASPNMQATPITAVGNGVHNQLRITATYIRQIWYQLQLTLNQRDETGSFTGNTPNDFPYVYNHDAALGYNAVPVTPQGGLMLLWMIKGLQAINWNGNGPEVRNPGGTAGWSPIVADPQRLFYYSVNTHMWDDWAPADRTKAMTAYLQYWANKATSFKAQQYYDGLWATPTDVVDPGFPQNSFANSVAYSTPVALYYGVPKTWGQQVVTWAKTVWPAYNWDALLTATCKPGTLSIVCTP